VKINKRRRFLPPKFFSVLFTKIRINKNVTHCFCPTPVVTVACNSCRVVVVYAVGGGVMRGDLK